MKLRFWKKEKESTKIEYELLECNVCQNKRYHPFGTMPRSYCTCSKCGSHDWKVIEVSVWR